MKPWSTAKHLGLQIKKYMNTMQLLLYLLDYNHAPVFNVSNFNS